MTKARYMALADFQTIWTNQIKPKIPDISGALYPVNVNTLTPSSTFVKNAVIGINGVIYRAKQATSHYPVVLVTQDGAFVVNTTANGKIAFVVSDPTIHQDWEMWTDAAIEYWVESLNAALAATVKTTDVYMVGNTSYTVGELLQSVADFMQKTVVVNE